MRKVIDWFRVDGRYLTTLKIIVIGLLPLVSCLIYCSIQGYRISDVYLPGSEWNDELFYFKQVEAIVNYGFPQGYYGFNESHALKLSFAAWSPILVFPWVLWGLVFGWNLLSPVICNIVLMTLACVIFAWLVKPTRRQMGILVLLFFLYTPFVRYMLSGMPEVICFSMLIVFYSIVISYLRKETVGKLIWLFVLSGLLTLMRPYMLLFLLLPCIFTVVKLRWKGFIVSGAVLAVVLGIYAMIKHYLGAEYFAPLFFTDWVTAFFEQGLFGGLRYFCSKLYWNGLAFLQHMQGGALAGLASGAFFWGYLAVLAVLAVQTVIDWCVLRKQGLLRLWKRSEDMSAAGEQKDRERIHLLVVEAHLAVSFIGMLFALLLMYKLTEGSKHLLTFMAAGVFIISLLKTRFYKKAVFIGAVFAYFYIYMALDPYDYQVPFREEAQIAQVESWEQTFSDTLVMTGENVPNYENAIIWVFSDMVDGKSVNTKWQLLYGLPEGFGISCCMRDYVIENFAQLQNRYLATVSGGEIDQMCKAAGLEELGRDEDIAVYCRY